MLDITVPPGSLLERVVETAREDDGAAALIAFTADEAREQLGDIERALTKPLGMEQRVIPELQIEESRLKAFIAFGRPVYKFPLSVLRWRNDRGFPKLGIFSIRHSDVTITEESDLFFHDQWRNSGGVRVKAPVVIQKQHSDVGPTIRRTRMVRRPLWASALIFGVGLAGAAVWMLAGGLHPLWAVLITLVSGSVAWDDHKETRLEGDPLQLRAAYTGVVPNRARALIRQAEEIFEQVFIVAETEFVLEKVPPPPPHADPLILGFKGEQLWLVGSFYTSSLEELIVRQVRGDLDE